jgi:hypothetical protein
LGKLESQLLRAAAEVVGAAAAVVQVLAAQAREPVVRARGGTGQSSTTGGTNQGAGSVGHGGRPTNTGRPTDATVDRPRPGDPFAPGSRNPPTTPGPIARHHRHLSQLPSTGSLSGSSNSARRSNPLGVVVEDTVVASWDERRAWRDEFRSLGVELVCDRLRLAAWHEDKLQEARRWLWWEEHLVTIIVISMGTAVAIAAALIGLLR